MKQSKKDFSKEELLFIKGIVSKAKLSMLENKDSATQNREFKKYLDKNIDKFIAGEN